MKKSLVYAFIAVAFLALMGCEAPLVKAAREGDLKTVRGLLETDTDAHEKNLAMIYATKNGRNDIAKMLIDKGADVNGVACFVKDKITTNNPECSWTMLAVAVRYGQVETTKVLMERGADVDMAISKLAGVRARAEKAQAASTREYLERVVKKQDIAQQAATKQKPSDDAAPVVKSDVDDPPAAKTKTNKNAYAIVIGVEKYRQRLPRADYAAHDAQTMTDYLTKVLGYPEENVVTLINDRATKSDMEKYFEKWLPNNAEKDGTVFVYYSGHGAPDPKTGSAYLVPYDGDPSFIDQTGYSLKRMYEALGKLPAKEIIVALDSCFSGAGGRSVLAKGARPLVMSLQDKNSLPQNVTVLSAASGEQISSTFDEKGHGLFTYFMLKGIKNEDVTKEDGTLKMEDLYGYIKPQVERIARKQYNNEQTPQLMESKKN
jgi:hypothetical protein